MKSRRPMGTAETHLALLMLVGCPLHVEHARARLPEVLRVVARVEIGRAHREQLLVGRERDVQGEPHRAVVPQPPQARRRRQHLVKSFFWKKNFK